MRTACLLLILLVAAPCWAQEPRKKIPLDAPTKWGGETLRLPPGFAKDMTLRGVEHIRFAPGMMKADSDTFFCYALVLELEGSPVLSKDALHDELLKYYRGLCTAVMRDKSLDTSDFSLKITQDTSEKSIRGKRYLGLLDWIEPFATKKRQQLNLEIQSWKRADQTFVFLCASPKGKDAAIWRELRKIRDGYLEN